MTTHAIPFVPAVPRAGFGRVIKAVRAYFRYQKTQQELSRLDAYMLRDIGMTPPAEDPVTTLLRVSMTR